MKDRTATLLGADGNPCDALLRFGLKPIDLVEVEARWGPFRSAAMLRLANPEAFPEHWHWNWARKAPALRLLVHAGVGIECQGEMQGLMLLTLAGHPARLHPDQGKELVYVDFLESAPWNVKPLVSVPRYRGIGARMMQAAVEISRAQGFSGRIGLHSLPQSAANYERYGLTPLGPDPAKQHLAYFEWSRHGAATFVEEGGRT